MSAALQSQNHKPRQLTSAEKRLVEILLSKGSGLSFPRSWTSTILVTDMADGGMGSLRFETESNPATKQRIGKQYSEVWFQDVDGVDVCATLFLDDKMNPLELDIWRVDFSPLISIPNTFPESS